MSEGENMDTEENDIIEELFGSEVFDLRRDVKMDGGDQLEILSLYKWMKNPNSNETVKMIVQGLKKNENKDVIVSPESVIFCSADNQIIDSSFSYSLWDLLLYNPGFFKSLHELSKMGINVKINKLKQIIDGSRLKPEGKSYTEVKDVETINVEELIKKNLKNAKEYNSVSRYLTDNKLNYFSFSKADDKPSYYFSDLEYYPVFNEHWVFNTKAFGVMLYNFIKDNEKGMDFDDFFNSLSDEDSEFNSKNYENVLQLVYPRKNGYNRDLFERMNGNVFGQDKKKIFSLNFLLALIAMKKVPRDYDDVCFVLYKKLNDSEKNMNMNDLYDQGLLPSDFVLKNIMGNQYVNDEKFKKAVEKISNEILNTFGKDATGDHVLLYHSKQYDINIANEGKTKKINIKNNHLVIELTEIQ